MVVLVMVLVLVLMMSGAADAGAGVYDACSPFVLTFLPQKLGLLKNASPRCLWPQDLHGGPHRVLGVQCVFSALCNPRQLRLVASHWMVRDPTPRHLLPYEPPEERSWQSGCERLERRPREATEEKAVMPHDDIVVSIANHHTRLRDAQVRHPALLGRPGGATAPSEFTGRARHLEVSSGLCGPPARRRSVCESRPTNGQPAFASVR